MKSIRLTPFFILITAFILNLFITGCGNSGASLANNSTEVQLNKANYRILAINVTGSAKSAYILGGSYSWGLATQSFGLIPLRGSKTLYKTAREDLWETFEQQYHTVKGEQVALINLQYDAATTNYLFYTSTKITLTADVIEFE